MFPLESLFRRLNDEGGRYVLVDGLAVVLHGHLRATGDVDLVVDLDPDQVNRTLAALERAGFEPYIPVPAREFADPAKRAEWLREKAMPVFSLRPAAGIPVVDLFLEPPLPFEDLWQRSVVMTMRGVPVRVVMLDDLIELKRRAGRPEDDADIACPHRDQTDSWGAAVTHEFPHDGRLPPDREALLRTTLALSVDERVGWLEAMIAIAIESGALPKRLPDQLAGARRDEGP
jgi:hypothetical protein